MIVFNMYIIMAAAKYIGAGLAAIGLTGAGGNKVSLIYTDTTKDFFNKVMESNKGQQTDNVFIIANRFLKAGNKPNADIINQVLRLENEEKFDNNMADLFQKLYDKRVIFEHLPISRENMIKFRNLGKDSKPAGVYVFKHKTSGELCVGSSVDLRCETITTVDHMCD